MELAAHLTTEPHSTSTHQDLVLVVDLAAPAPPETEGGAPRAGSSLQVVLDRGAAMTGQGLDGALDAIAAIVQRLDARDSFGLVAFGDEAEVVVPAGPLTDPDEVVDRLAGLAARGGSDLAAGYRRGLEEIGRVAEDAGGTVLVVSGPAGGPDPRDEEELVRLARHVHESGIVTSTLRYGSARPSSTAAPSEGRLGVLAEAGSGTHHVAAEPVAAGAAIASEIADLMARSVHSVSLTVRPEEGVVVLGVNEAAACPTPDGAWSVELGDLNFEERVRLTVHLRAAATELGTSVHLAVLEVRYLTLPTLEEQCLLLPVRLNEPPGVQGDGTAHATDVAALVTES